MEWPKGYRIGHIHQGRHDEHKQPWRTHQYHHHQTLVLIWQPCCYQIQQIIYPGTTILVYRPVYGGNSHIILEYLPCLNDDNLALPRERRRAINSEKDEVFRINASGTLQQKRETSGYDCGGNTNCFTIHHPDLSDLAQQSFLSEVPDTYLRGDEII